MGYGDIYPVTEYEIVTMIFGMLIGAGWCARVARSRPRLPGPAGPRRAPGPGWAR